MIQVNELRVGNLVYYGGIILTVTQTSKSKIVGVTAIKSLFKCSYDEIDPIYLTTQSILLLGIEEKIYTHEIKEHCNTEKALCININLDDGQKRNVDVTSGRFSNDGAIDDSVCCYPLKQVKSVHQLQNLYFALTGLELKK